jgi:peptidoglycan hydrolase CwlO-like protein
MMIEEGDRAQKEGAEALGRIEKNIIVMDEQANVIMTELDRQIEKLDQIYEELNDTETTLKR